MDKALIARSFAKALKTYDGSAVVQRRVVREMVRLMRAHDFPEASAIYEVGAGTGLLTAALLAEFKPSRIVANDLCLEAGEPLGALSRRVEFVHGDAETLPVPPGCTAIVSCSAVQWFADVWACFRNFANGLPAGGVLAFSTFGPTNLCQIREITGMGLDYKSLPEHVALLERAGFAVVEAVENLETVVLGGVGELLRHIRETGVGGVEREPAGLAQAVRFRREYEARFSVPGGISLTYHPLYFMARRREA